MELHLLKLILGELPGLVYYFIGDMYLSHVMKKARDINGILLGLRFSEPPRYLLRVKGDSEGMAACVPVLGVNHTHQCRNRLRQCLRKPRLRFHETLGLDGNLCLQILPVCGHELLMSRSFSNVQKP